MSTEMCEKLTKLVGQMDVEGLRQLAYQELKRDGLLIGDQDDVSRMMDEMKDIMRLRFEEDMVKRCGDIVMRQIRKNLGEGLLTWVMKKHAEAYVSAMADDIEHVELGVAG